MLIRIFNAHFFYCALENISLENTMIHASSIKQMTEKRLLSGKNDIVAMNNLLSDEISAVETYTQALSQFECHDIKDVVEELRRIRKEHQSAIDILRSHVLANGGKPYEGSGLWGVFTTAVTGGVKAIGLHATISALRFGEEHGVGEYEEVFRMEDVSTDCKYLLYAELIKCKRHIETLDHLADELLLSSQ